MENNILLSICMPTYNRLHHIQRQIHYFIKEMESVDLKNVEIIVSNNASTDDTGTFLAQYEGKFEWLRINNNKENIGAYSNMTLLLQMASGKYIWIPGDDDYLKKGLVKRVYNILSNNNLSYLYISRRTINEKTCIIEKEGKKHCVEYDKPIEVSYPQIVSLLKENYGDLKFQTSSVFERERALVYYKEASFYPEDTQANCHSLFKSVRAIQEGKSFFISDVCILNGMDISWGDSFIHYVFECDPLFVSGLSKFGIKQKDCYMIRKRQIAAAVLGCIANKSLWGLWKKSGYVGWSTNLLPVIVYLSFRKIIRAFGMSKTYLTAEVDFEEFKS